MNPLPRIKEQCGLKTPRICARSMQVYVMNRAVGLVSCSIMMLTVCGWTGVARDNRQHPVEVHSLHAELLLHTNTHTLTVFHHGYRQRFITSAATNGSGC
jgi:hypothetical protein